MTSHEDERTVKPVVRIGSSKGDISDLPTEVKLVFGQALYLAQIGRKHPDAKPLTGIEGGVLEVVEDFDKNTYRGEAGPRTANQGKGETMKTKTRKKNNTITESSGNVFADIGVAEPEQALAKAKLAAKIAAAIDEEKLTQTEAAERLGTDQSKVSAIIRGRLDQFSTERLLQYAQMIGYDVEIRFRRRRAGAGHLRVGA